MKFGKVWKNEEFRFYVGLVLSITFIVIVVLYFTENLSVKGSFRNAISHVVSIVTTTGYVTADYTKWVPFLWVIILILLLGL